jgi:hypothetical protein
VRPVFVFVAIALALAGSAARSGSAGVSLEVPAGWHAVRQSSLAAAPYSDPLTRVVVGSSTIVWRATGCQIASYSFSPRAVAIVVVEWRRAYAGVHYAPRPRRFTAATLPVERGRPVFECFDGGGGSVQFADHGRHFMASLLVGRRAPDRLVVRARAVLNTLRVRRR